MGEELKPYEIICWVGTVAFNEGKAQLVRYKDDGCKYGTLKEERINLGEIVDHSFDGRYVAIKIESYKDNP